MSPNYIVHRLIRDASFLICLIFTFASTPALTAQSTPLSLLDDPAGSMVCSLPKLAQDRLQVLVDGTQLTFGNPEILFEKHLPEADFISAGWKDATGKLLHQRDVLLVKSGYCVVIDYLYGTAQHAITTSFAFPSGNVEVGEQGAQCRLADGQTLRIQSLDPLAKIAGQTDAAGRAVFTSTKTLPAPIPVVLLAWDNTAAKKVEIVKAGNPMVVKLKVSFPDGRVDEVALAWESRPLHLNGKEFKGWSACLRHAVDGSQSFFEVN